jgi:hypothetical protein
MDEIALKTYVKEINLSHLQIVEISEDILKRSDEEIKVILEELLEFYPIRYNKKESTLTKNIRNVFLYERIKKLVKKYFIKF